MNTSDETQGIKMTTQEEAKFNMDVSEVQFDTATHVFAELVSIGRFEEAKMWEAKVHPFMSPKVLGGLSLHHWLATQENNQAWESWKRIFKHAVASPHFNMNNIRGESYTDTVTLLLVSDKPARIDDLIASIEAVAEKHDIDLWAGRVSTSRWPSKVEKVNAYLSSLDDFGNSVSIWEAVSYHGDEMLFQKTLRERVARGELKLDRHKSLGLMFTFGGEWQVQTFVDAIDAVDGWAVSKNANRSGFSRGQIIDQYEVDLFVSAAKNLPTKKLEVLLDRAFEEDGVKKALIAEFSKWHVVRGLLKNHRFESLRFIEKKYRQGYTTATDGISEREMWDAIDRDDLAVVKFLVEHSPEMMEAKEWVWRGGSDGTSSSERKSGNPLAMAVLKNKENIAMWLFQNGADVKQLKSLFEYAPFKKTKEFREAESLASKIVLVNMMDKKTEKMSIEMPAAKKKTGML